MDEDGVTQLKIGRARLLHGLGTLLLWGSVALALLNIHYMALLPDWFWFNFVVCLGVALTGGWLKRRYCPRCWRD